MQPWIQLDTAQVAGGQQLRLMRRGDEFSIMLGTNELMNSRVSGSEQALATLTCERLGKSSRLEMLIGGLGMGFTLAAALAVLGAEARVIVAEISPHVIGWARGPLAAIFAGSLDDPRTEIREADVAGIIADSREAFDAILLDVDNGPDGLTRADNDVLYRPAGLKAARNALRPGGILAVWSAHPDAQFTRRLHSAGFAVEELKVRARPNGRGSRHVIWLATKSKPDQAARPIGLR